MLKDQMLEQEKLLADLKQGTWREGVTETRPMALQLTRFACIPIPAVTPQMSNINEEAQDAIDEMRLHLMKAIESFRTEMDSEVKKTLGEVAALREQKKMLQSDLADLLAFKSKYGGGAPENIALPKAAYTPKSPAFGVTGAPAPRPDSTGPGRGLRGPR